MARKRNARKIIEVDIADLKPNPRQSDYFSAHTKQAIQDLAELILKNGVDPIDITQDYTTVAGHGRVEAYRLLGRTRIPAIIREDLAAQGDAAIEQHLIADNFTRRQLSKLDRVRCGLRLKELAAGMKIIDMTSSERQLMMGSTRDYLSKLMVLSPREVNRLLAVLRTPPAVQQAYDNGQLPIVLAERVANLSTVVQDLIAAAIIAGEVPKQVVQQHLMPPDTRTRQQTLACAYSKFFGSLRTAVVALEGNILEIDIGDVGSRADLDVLQRAHRVPGATHRSHAADN